MQKYEHVLAMLIAKGGRIAVNDPDLVALLGDVHYRLTTYMSFIRRFAHLNVTAIYEILPGETPTDKPKRSKKVAFYELEAITAVPVKNGEQS